MWNSKSYRFSSFADSVLKFSTGIDIFVCIQKLSFPMFRCIVLSNAALKSKFYAKSFGSWYLME